MKGTIVFDFDGVIHKYSKGWQNGSIYDEPNQSVIKVIDKLRANDYIVDIVSTRCATEEGAKSIGEWLNKYGIEVDHILAHKPPALVYIDDRAINFDPLDKNLYEEIINFIPKQKEEEKYNKLSDLELLYLIQQKTKEFEQVNNEFDNKHKGDGLLGLKIIDEWTSIVKKYL